MSMVTDSTRRIYHITHMDNLASIVQSGGLESDAKRAASASGTQEIGMSTIKQRRTANPVAVNPGTTVADYVPFYFCPRSIMLYVIHRGNHPELHYKGGQEPILHLSAELSVVLAWLQKSGVRWAFSNANAGSTYARFSNNAQEIATLDWAAIGARDFRDPSVKEGKQAEFLVFGTFPFGLFDMIGVFNQAVAERVTQALHGRSGLPQVAVRPRWYY